MIPIKLNSISLTTIDTIIALSNTGTDSSQLTENEIENTIGKPIEELIENFMLHPHSDKTELAAFLLNLNKQELAEVLALYYFFSKLTYDTTVISDNELHAFWEVCGTNAINDLARVGHPDMIDYLKERTNLGVILSTAVLNLK